MNLYRLLSALLSYPEPELLDALGDVETALRPYPEANETLRPLIGYLAANDLIGVQENYVATFDRNRSHSLHLFEHVHGESRDRGQAMVDLLQTYRQHGFEPVAAELPDHVPLFLEFLGVIDEAQALDLLDEAIHVIAAIGARLAKADSPYACVFIVLRSLARVIPRVQTEAPVRDMDEAMETFGVSPDGMEPLLRPFSGDGAQPVRFYSRPPATIG
ncbi:nitrate reductase molybdenum cofactor assembly chaperone [Comamonas testosteroni]|uniref:nitrate reductase molybdenum cofactor assembly chaperone n=1 Tax=Comamonas testosteroni TaxID=285 RepID=UPI0006802599|nr:nitrate reductase molybdenum cofactor assembly chaperone [Comamonas testosteroni]